jgi:hypothetical protein
LLIGALDLSPESGGFHLRFGRGSLGLGGSFVAGSCRFGWRRGLGWVGSWRQGFGLGRNQIRQSLGECWILWVDVRDGGWGGDDAGYFIFVVLNLRFLCLNVKSIFFVCFKY